MAKPLFNSVPKDVPKVQTKHRRIATRFPVPESLPIIEGLRRAEPRSMGGQPPVIWDRAEGFQVHDKWGNMWLDMSSGVLITNCGHGHPKIRAAIRGQVDKPLLTTYCFANEPRVRLVDKIVEITAPGLDKVFLLTTGSESTENAIKLARTYGMKVGGPSKSVLISFENGFHGRTMGAQLAGGSPGQKAWIGELDPRFVQVPFPDGYWGEDTSFDGFLKSLEEQGVRPEDVCGVISETYQGATAAFMPTPYAQRLRQWCTDHDVLLILDEVQAGFGRTGKMFGYEHYGITPDLICCGKGASSSLPLSCVVGRQDVMDLYAEREMTSTHSGNPVCTAAALANIEVIEEEGLVQNAVSVGARLQEHLKRLADDYDFFGAYWGTGLVAGLIVVKPGTREVDAELALRIVERCVEKGLLFFAPVGKGGGTLKFAPPLCLTAEAADEAAAVLREAIEEVI